MSGDCKNSNRVDELKRELENSYINYYRGNFLTSVKQINQKSDSWDRLYWKVVITDFYDDYLEYDLENCQNQGEVDNQIFNNLKSKEKLIISELRLLGENYNSGKNHYKEYAAMAKKGLKEDLDSYIKQLEKRCSGADNKERHELMKEITCYSKFRDEIINICP